MSNQSGIADKVNMEAIKFIPSPIRGGSGNRIEKALVNFGSSAGTLFFNSKMTQLLDMRNWKHAIVGYDPSTHIIILKEGVPEEECSVNIQITKPKKDAGEASKERILKCRTISIKHLVREIGLDKHRRYRAERSGKMIFLEPNK